MAVRMSLQTIYGLFGPSSPSTPISGSTTALHFLAQEVATGLHIVNAVSKSGNPDSSHVIDIATNRLQLAGRIPMDLDTFRSLSDQQREALGFEPYTLNQASSMQDFGAPPFKDLDVASILAALRFAARCQQLKAGFKPIFQVGFVTMTVNGHEQGLFAQTLQVEDGAVTDTIWLYRWVVMGVDGEYVEHWRPFDGPVTVTPTPQQQLQPPRQQVPSYPPIPQPTIPIPQHQPQPQHKAETLPTRLPRLHRSKPYETFQFAHLSDDELLASPPDLLQGNVILRLAQKYSNGEIFARIKAASPGKISSVNVITKRLTHAIEAAAEAEGVMPAVVRTRIREAKEANGVAHKAKVDVAPYV